MFDFESVQHLRKTGQYEAAKELVRQYVETAPNDPAVLYQMAWCHDSLGEEQAAVPYYEQALALGLAGEDRLQAYIGLGSTYRVIGQRLTSIPRDDGVQPRSSQSGCRSVTQESCCDVVGRLDSDI